MTGTRDRGARGITGKIAGAGRLSPRLFALVLTERIIAA